MSPKSDQRVTTFIEWVIRWRYPILILSVLVMLLPISGARFLTFSTDYRDFFSEENPQLTAFESLQKIYTKNDNILFMLDPADGDGFSPQALAAAERLTAEAWKIPHALRVDAVTNFQYTHSNEDDLIVEDLVENATLLSADELADKQSVALAEPLISGRLIADDAHVNAVNVTLQLPGKDITETPAAVEAARALAARIESEFPGIKVYMTGVVMLDNAFSEAGQRDLAILSPIVYGAMLLVMFLFLRSIAGTIATLIIISLSSLGAMGLAGWMGVKLTPPTVTAPTMIMTLAVADSIHILVTMFGEMKRGVHKFDAIKESMRVNMQPVFLTSLTTAIGFLSMNFSDAPPFRDLGNITAAGVAIAFGLSVVFLPAFMAAVPCRVPMRKQAKTPLMDRFAEFVIHRKRPLLWGSVAAVLLFGAFVPKNELNDQFVSYFNTRITFRTDTDHIMDNLTGIYAVEHSLGAASSGGISDPAYLAKLDEFADWYRQQPEVMHVTSFSDIMKRLNKNLHGDDPAYYRVPNNRELAAQYLLLYEMSLPYGLDLNNQINIDKSATRFTATLANVQSNTIKDVAQRAEKWLRENAPETMYATGSGPSVMFSYIAERNIKSMLMGTGLAIVLIAITLLVALRSFKYGLLSLVPNLVPAILAFGTWGVLVGEIGLALSVVSAMTLGIVVDDSVHFITKYLRARRVKQLSPNDSVRYAFSTVGRALVVTTVILIAGFLVLSFSSFKLNSGMGQLTAITITFALIADFLLLPAVLLWADRREQGTNEMEEYDEVRQVAVQG